MCVPSLAGSIPARLTTHYPSIHSLAAVPDATRWTGFEPLSRRAEARTGPPSHLTVVGLRISRRSQGMSRFM